MSFNIPNTFIAGTKARADEVNENFASIQDELNKNIQNLAKVKEDLDYIKGGMFDDFIEEAKKISKGLNSKFSINSGNLALDGVTPDILDYNDNILSFKTGGNYPNIVVTNALGDTETFEYIEELDVSSYTDGIYNVYLHLSGFAEIHNTKLTRSPKEPAGVVINDVWLRMLEPWCCYKFNGISWVEYNCVPLGTITIKSGSITNAENNNFNTQYLDSDCVFLTKRARSNISRRFESDWFSGAAKMTYTFEHNLNIDPLRYKVRLIARIREDFGNFKAGDIVETLYSNYAGNEAGVEIGYILKFNKNSITVGMGNSDYHCCNDFGATGCCFLPREKVEYKIIATEDVN